MCGAHLSIDGVPVVVAAPEAITLAVEVGLHEVGVIHHQAVVPDLKVHLADLRVKGKTGVKGSNKGKELNSFLNVKFTNQL